MNSTGFKNSRIGLPTINKRKQTISPKRSSKAFSDMRNTKMKFFNDLDSNLQKQLVASDALGLKMEVPNIASRTFSML